MRFSGKKINSHCLGRNNKTAVLWREIKKLTLSTSLISERFGNFFIRIVFRNQESIFIFGYAIRIMPKGTAICWMEFDLKNTARIVLLKVLNYVHIPLSTQSEIMIYIPLRDKTNCLFYNKHSPYGTDLSASDSHMLGSQISLKGQQFNSTRTLR